MKKTFTHFLALSACLLFSIVANARGGNIVTSETFSNYFGSDGYLLESVPAGSILDFQGTFQGEQYSLYINKKVYVISSTGDAFFDSNSNTTDRKWMKFNVVAGADSTEIYGLEFLNCDLFVIGASNVTIDGIKMTSNMKGVGSGTGFLAIHTNADSAVVKNSYFENGGTGSSILVVGKGSKKAVFDNNTFKVTGSSGNVMSANIYVGSGEVPSHITYTNNTIVSEVASSASMYGITVCSEGNLIEGNDITMLGNAITNQYGATATNNIYRNNKIYGGGTMGTGTNCIVEGNELYGTLTVGAGSTVTGNTVSADVKASGKKVTFTDNTINGTLTLNSDSNTVVNNTIKSDAEYAVVMNAKVGNVVTDNALIAAEKSGDAAVSYTGTDATANRIENNTTVTAVNGVEAAADEYVVSSNDGVISVTGVGEDAVCNLYNAIGTHLASQKVGRGDVTFTVPTKGVYLIEVVNNNRKSVKKIIAGK